MLRDYILGFRIRQRGRRDLRRLIQVALSQISMELGGLSALVRSWDFEDVSGLLLLHVVADPRSLEDLSSLVKSSLSNIIGEEGEVDEAPLSSQGVNYVQARSMLPSPITLGFLLRAKQKCGELKTVNRLEALTLVLAYVTMGDLQRMAVTSAFLDLDPEDLSKTLKSLRSMGLVELGENVKLRDGGVKLLNELIPSLRLVSEEAKVSPVKVLDESGGVEDFSPDKLASSLYKAGISYPLVSRIVPAISRMVKEEKILSKSYVVLMVCSMLQELEPAKASAARFHAYVYALQKIFVKGRGGLRRLSWSYVRAISRRVLGERGLKPPSRLVKIHSERIVEEIKSRITWSLYGGEVWVLGESELLNIAKSVAPYVSRAWVDLSSKDSTTLMLEYLEEAVNLIGLTDGVEDYAERKLLTMKAIHRFSSALLIWLGLLPSNEAEINVGVLRGEVRRIAAKEPALSSTWGRVKRACSLSLRLLRSPPIPAPNENVEIRRALRELSTLFSRIRVEVERKISYNTQIP